MLPPDDARQRARARAPRRAGRVHDRAGVRRGAGRPGSPELVPIAFAGVVISTLFDRRVSLLAAVLLAVLIASQPSYSTAAALPS